MRWSVSIVAEGDRVLTHEEIVELADVVVGSSGIASGIGTTSYGAQLVVEAATADEAVESAVAEFGRAATRAGLPAWPITHVETMSEDEDADAVEDGVDRDLSPHRSRPQDRHSSAPIADMSEEER
jgi:hypothetical protein